MAGTEVSLIGISHRQMANVLQRSQTESPLTEMVVFCTTLDQLATTVAVSTLSKAK